MDVQRFLRRLFKTKTIVSNEKHRDSTQKTVKSRLVGAVWTAMLDAHSAACGNLFLA